MDYQKWADDVFKAVGYRLPPAQVRVLADAARALVEDMQASLLDAEAAMRAAERRAAFARSDLLAAERAANAVAALLVDERAIIERCAAHVETMSAFAAPKDCAAAIRALHVERDR